MFDYGNANENQRKAIKAVDGPLLIIAGPGTGKTFTVVKRAAYLITEKGVPPEDIMIATFTEKAAKEIITRITDEMIGIGVVVNIHEMYIGTFHSICLRIIKENLEFTRIKKNYRMLDSFDQQYAIFQNIGMFRRIEEFNSLFDMGAWRQAKVIADFANNISEELVDYNDLYNDPDLAIKMIADFSAERLKYISLFSTKRLHQAIFAILWMSCSVNVQNSRNISRKWCYFRSVERYFFYPIPYFL